MPKQKKVQPRRRTVTPNGPALRSIRIKKQISAEKLAALADCSEGTIENLEKSEEAFPFTLVNVANALGVKLEMLLADASQLPADPTYADGYINVDITVSREIADIDQCKDLGSAIAFLMKQFPSEKPMLVVRMHRGSTIVTVAMDEEMSFLFYKLAKHSTLELPGLGTILNVVELEPSDEEMWARQDAIDKENQDSGDEEN